MKTAISSVAQIIMEGINGNVSYRSDENKEKKRKESVSFKALPTDRRIKQYINAHM